MNWKFCRLLNHSQPIVQLLSFCSATIFSLTILIEALIFGLFAMSLDLLIGYCRLFSFGHAAAYGLGAYASGRILINTGMPLLFGVFAAALLTGVMAIGVGWMCTLERRVVRDAHACLRAARLRHRFHVDFGDRGLRWLVRYSEPCRSVRLRRAVEQDRLLLSGLGLSARRVPGSRASCVRLRRRASRHPRERGQDHGARLQRPPLQGRRRGHRLRLGGLAGALYAPFAGFANAELFLWLVGRVLIMVSVGGAGTLVGPIIGGAFFVLIEHELAPNRAWALLFGLIFIGFVMFAPAGYLGTCIVQAAAGAPHPRAGIGGAA